MAPPKGQADYTEVKVLTNRRWLWWKGDHLPTFEDWAVPPLLLLLLSSSFPLPHDTVSQSPHNGLVRLENLQCVILNNNDFCEHSS